NDDCDSSTPDPTITCYRDADGDGERGSATMSACSCPSGWLPATALVDCCDSDSQARHGAASYHTTANGCGNFDFDCDGAESRDTSSVIDTNVYPFGIGYGCPSTPGTPIRSCLAAMHYYCNQFVEP